MKKILYRLLGILLLSLVPVPIFLLKVMSNSPLIMLGCLLVVLTIPLMSFGLMFIIEGKFPRMEDNIQRRKYTKLDPYGEEDWDGDLEEQKPMTCVSPNKIYEKTHSDSYLETDGAWWISKNNEL
jgi:hypothetical protein